MVSIVRSGVCFRACPHVCFTVIKTLESFEEQFLKIIPFLPRLRKLSWLLHAVPLSDGIWTSLLRHCPKLSTIDLANANGILPESHVRASTFIQRPGSDNDL